MLFFGKQTEYEIMGQTYIELMTVLNSKGTIQVEKIHEIEGYNVYFLSIIYSIIESGIIKSKYQLAKIKCNLFDVVDIVEHVYSSDFYNRNLVYKVENHAQYVDEISEFLYDNLLIFYDKFLENNKDYVPNEVKRNKGIELIKKGVDKALKGPFPAPAIKFVSNLSENFYNHSKFREGKSIKELVINFLESVNID